MRNLYAEEIEKHRDKSDAIVRHYGNTGDDTCGVFDIPSPIDGVKMKVLASSWEGWDHVSVSRKNRCPNWTEMEFVKRTFFNPDEVCMQLHVAVSEHISLHPYCLHIWRPNVGTQIPLPPSFMVA